MKKKKGLIITLTVFASIALMAGFYMIVHNLPITKAQYQKYYDSDKYLIQCENGNYEVQIGHVNEEEIKFSYKMSGIASMWKLTADHETEVSFTCENTLQKGEFKVYAVLPDNTITTLFEGSYNDEIHLTLPEGDTLIKIAAVSASGKINMQVDDLQDVKIEAIDHGFILFKLED